MCLSLEPLSYLNMLKLSSTLGSPPDRTPGTYVSISGPTELPEYVETFLDTRLPHPDVQILDIEGGVGITPHLNKNLNIDHYVTRKRLTKHLTYCATNACPKFFPLIF